MLSQLCHELDSKTTVSKIAFPQGAQTKMMTQTKIFMRGGLPIKSTVDEVKQYFEQLGR